MIIYLLICGFPPFFDNQGNEQKLFQLIKRGKFQFVGMFFDECHPSLKELISDLLKKRPVERLTAQEVRGHEWFTGIKQPKKAVPKVINPFLDDDHKQNGGGAPQSAVVNPFLNKEPPKQQQYVPPYLRFQQNEQKHVPGPPGPPQQQYQPGPPQHGAYGMGKAQPMQQWRAPGPPGPPGPPK